MPLVIRCPHCSTAVQLPDGSAGKQFRCPTCQKVFAVGAAPARQPVAAGAPAAAPAPPARPAAPPAAIAPPPARPAPPPAAAPPRPAAPAPAKPDPQEFAIRLNFFRREAEILRSLEGVEVVPRVYDLIEQGQTAHLVMEFIRGQDLLKVMELNGGRPFDVGQVAEWGQSVCDVLTH